MSTLGLMPGSIRQCDSRPEGAVPEGIVTIFAEEQWRIVLVSDFAHRAEHLLHLLNDGPTTNDGVSRDALRVDRIILVEDGKLPRKTRPPAMLSG